MATFIEFAERFGNLIAKGDYVGAHALLTKKAQTVHSPEDFKESVEAMTAYAPGPIQRVVVMEDFIVDDWPDKDDGDIASVYISLESDAFCEAVTVILTQETGDIRISELEWGRP